MCVRFFEAGVALGALGLGCMIAGSTGARAIESPGCLAGGRPGKVAAVTPALELLLDDGETVLIPGLDAVRATAERPAGAEVAQAALAGWLVGRTVTLNPQLAEPDRWGRTVALVFAPLAAAVPPAGPEPPIVSVAEAMLDAGLARAKQDGRVGGCWKTFLALEQGARASGVGLWADPFYSVVAADDRGALQQRVGGMAIVEGRVVRISQGRARRYIGFAQDRDGFTVTLERVAERRLGKAGLDVTRWIGKRVRVRGFLDDRFGLQIELTSLDQVEFIEP